MTMALAGGMRVSSGFSLQSGCTPSRSRSRSRHQQHDFAVGDNGNHLQQCLPPNSSSDDPNNNYFTSLCTVFVATIQEAKDRISQIEFIFCSQLFPTFQSELTKFRNMSKRLEKIKQGAEEEWNRNKKTLLLELDKLQTGRKTLKAQIQFMKTSFEQEKKELCSAFELQKEELHRKHSLEREELFSRLEAVQKSDETLKLREELQQRLEEIAEGKLLHENLLQQISRMDDELKIERLRENLHGSELERERKSKQDLTEQYKYLKRMYKGLKTQYDVIIKLNGIGTDKSLSAKKKAQNDSHTSPDNLKQTSLFDYQAEAPYRGEARMAPEDKEADINSNGNPTEADHQDSANIDNKAKDVPSRESIARSHSSKKEQDVYQVNLKLDKRLENAQSEESPSKTSVDSSKCVPFEDEETQEQVNEVSRQAENHSFRGVKEKRESLASFPQQKQLLKRPLEPMPGPPNLVKRKNSSWRETRLRKEPGKGVDPHDDFLDTPMETALQSVKQKLEARANEPGTSTVQENCAYPGEAQACQTSRNNLILDDDDETQAIDPDCAQQTSHARSANLVCNSGGMKLENLILNNKSPSYVGKSKEQNQRHAHKDGTSYKYIEPVRKKADRETLKGVECNQCKKFYDAVQVGDGNATGDIRCEHHNEVSRHRYRYVPPATPEGFWNIGFDSDL